MLQNLQFYLCDLDFPLPEINWEEVALGVEWQYRLGNWSVSKNNQYHSSWWDTLMIKNYYIASPSLG